MAEKGKTTKENIVINALHLFSVKGYFNTSVKDIQDATGLTKGGLYGHFKSKEQIWYAACDRAVDIWKQIVFSGVHGIENPLERIKKALENDLMHYLGKNVFPGGCFFLNMLVELSGQSEEMSRHVLDGMNGFGRGIDRWLKEAGQKDMLRPGVRTDEIAEFIIVSISGCAALYASNRDAAVLETTLEQISVLLDSLKK